MKNKEKDSSTWESLSILAGLIGYVVFKSSLFLIVGLLIPVLFGRDD